MAAPAVSLITLGVRDVARSAAFYESLGFERSTASQESIVFLRAPGAQLALFGAGDLAADAGLPLEPLPRFRGVTLARNLPAEADVDRAHAAALAAGATELVAPKPTFWGGYHAYHADPDGHAWELAVNPFVPLGEDGLLTLP